MAFEPNPENLLSPSTVAMPKIRILVMDGYADAAESLMMLLQMEGREVEIAFYGVKANEFPQTLNSQVFLLDIGIPDLNNYEVARQLHRLPDNHGVILIALTGLD